MASCVAVIGKTNSPLYLRCVDPNLELSFHYTVHTSLDVVEEKTTRCPPNDSPRELYIGSLFSTEAHKVFGYVSNTQIKFIIIADSSSSARESEIRRMFRSLHEAYSSLVSNPFYIPGTKIESPRFDRVVSGILAKAH